MAHTCLYICDIGVINTTYPNAPRLRRFVFFTTGNETKSNDYNQTYGMRVRQMRDVFWDNTTGSWFDYSISSNTQRTGHFYTSNLFPLYAGCVEDSVMYKDKVLTYLQVS